MQFDLFEKKQISNFVACIVITLFCFLLYGKTLSYGITLLDDTALISQGASFSLKNFLTTGAISADTNLAYRPFLNLSFAADYLLNGSGVYFSHLINILMHIAAVCLFYYFLISFKINANYGLAASLIFAAHPAASVAVPWIPGRNDTLMAVFTLSAFIFLLKWTESCLQDSDTHKNFSKLFLYSLFFSATLLSKESAVAIPILAVPFFAITCINRNKKNISHTLALYVLSNGIPMLIWHYLRRNSVLIMPLPDIPSILSNMPYLPMVIGRAIFPTDICVIRMYEQMNVLYAYIAIVFFVAFVFLIRSFINRKEYKRLFLALFGICWFMLLLLPTMIGKTGLYYDDAFFDHRIYLPLAGLILAAMQIILPKRTRLCTMYAAFAYLLMCLGITWIRSSFYEDKKIFMEQFARDYPQYFDGICIAGKLNEDESLYGAAEYYFGLAEKINPDYPAIHMHLAYLAYKRGDIETASMELEKEIKKAPDNETARSFLNKLNEMKENPE